MSNKIITLETLQAFQQEAQQYIDQQDALAIKSAKYANNVLSLYKTEDMSGDPDISLNLPEEMFLDQTKTKFESNFTWSNELYPGSTNPNLEGKMVLILAVRGDTSINYSFISLDTLIRIYEGVDTNTVSITVENNNILASVKVSTAEGNAITTNDDGLYVNITSNLVYATNEEVLALWS